MKSATMKAMGWFAVLALAAFATTACDDFMLTGLLDGESGQPLSVTPAATDVAVNATITFTASGGYPPYSYTVMSGEGTVDARSGVYFAPGSDGESVIRVTDQVNNIVEASVRVVVPTTTNVAYQATNVSADTGWTAGELFSGYFSYTNKGSDPGTHSIEYQVFASADTSLQYGADFLVAGGWTDPLIAGESSDPVYFDGTWPTTPGTYYLILSLITAPDDLTTNDNVVVSIGSVTTSGPPAPFVDYMVEGPMTAGATAQSGDSIYETFVLYNNGDDDGGVMIYWNAYISADDVLDVNDMPIDSGSVAPVASGNYSDPIPVDQGEWPVVADSQDLYLIIQVHATDDVDLYNNMVATAFWVDPPEVDYTIINVPNLDTVEQSTTSSLSFDIVNYGSSSGSDVVAWSAYLSNDPTYQPSDIVLDSGMIAALPSGWSSNVMLDCTWDYDPGMYWLIIQVSGAGDIAPENNMYVSTSFDIIAPAGQIDYVIDSITRDFPIGYAFESIEETVRVRNASTTDGYEAVEVTFFISDDEYIGDDIYLGYTTIGALTSGTTSGQIPFEGGWNLDLGTFFLVAEVYAYDEGVTTNNTSIQGPFTIVDRPDYEITTDLDVVDYAPVGFASATTGQMLSEIGNHEFAIHNAGAGDGRLTISWSAWLSTDPVLDGSDDLIVSGTSVPLGPGYSGYFPFDHPVPGEPGVYHIIIRINAPDDANAENNLYVSPPIHVWTPFNIEDDSGEDNWYPGSEVDYHFVLDAGESVVIDATMDTQAYEDLFMVRTGKGVTGLEVDANWGTGDNAIDLYMYQIWDDPADPPYSSESPAPEEYAYWTGPPAVQEYSEYYLDVWFNYLHAGEYYTLTITALP
jgi:hypothetical protein